jgi:hypothetical protein
VQGSFFDEPARIRSDATESKPPPFIFQPSINPSFLCHCIFLKRWLFPAAELSRKAPMTARDYIERILEDESLTDGLDEPEATLLVNTLVERAEVIGKGKLAETELESQIGNLRRLGRKLAQIVASFESDGPAAASKLAQKNAIAWPVKPPKSARELLQVLLAH